MRAEAKEAPNRITIERYDGMVDVVLCENITTVTKEDEQHFVFDIYRITVKDRKGLEASVDANFNAWVAQAKEAEKPPVDIDAQAQAELYAAIESATSIAQLKSALLGGMDKKKGKVKATK